MNIAKFFSLMLIALGFISLFFLKEASPFVRLLAASLGMIWVIKMAALIWQISDGVRIKSLLGLITYSTIWPGVSFSGFSERYTEPLPSTGSRFKISWLTFITGFALLIGVSLIGKGESTVLNYVALFSFLLIIHLGLIEVIADGIRLMGFSPSSLFDCPYLAQSLRDFWSFRWNKAFVDMNKIFLLNPLKSKVPHGLLIFSIFAISGLLHEVGISFADGASWGMPMSYFVIQAVGMEIEKRKALTRFLVWTWIILPAPLLFTPTFTNLFLGDLSRFISTFVLSINRKDFIQYGFIIGGISHLFVLCASVQVPGKLGWKEEFKKLSSLNRKVFWTYGGYIFSIIVFMSVVSFVLSKQNLIGMSLPVLLWPLFISIFWWARVITDFFYMSHIDWPRGPLFTVGHVCLTTLFMFLAILYSALAIVFIQAMPLNSLL